MLKKFCSLFLSKIPIILSFRKVFANDSLKEFIFTLMDIEEDKRKENFKQIEDVIEDKGFGYIKYCVWIKHVLLKFHSYEEQLQCLNRIFSKVHEILLDFIPESRLLEYYSYLNNIVDETLLVSPLDDEIIFN